MDRSCLQRPIEVFKYPLDGSLKNLLEICSVGTAAPPYNHFGITQVLRSTQHHDERKTGKCSCTSFQEFIKTNEPYFIVPSVFQRGKNGDWCSSTLFEILYMPIFFSLP